MAVLVRDAYKNYGTVPVIENLNITVRPGSIYGLLGASGCGKTTLLSCIVGLKQLNYGSINVFGHRPGEKGSGVPGPGLGFMPQESALYPIFTIAEELAYYGRIYGMTSKSIEKRTEFLVKFLNLPSASNRIDTLSGGENRRVALAVAMIHSPPLLVLDEPTVGLDPLLRQSIWNHMTELVKSEEKTTILITTHYIDEAKFCDVIGVLRRGRLLAEQNPQILMDFYCLNSLEDIVLRLCQEDELKHGPARRKALNLLTV
ncbi:ABC transporter G family member 23 [Folsomia candida]|uniref:ABC transporter G family member 23 n=1 Tax=Folsomia candida TaxID=158441 RepID=UPI001604B1B8|nr:ABC transporter G family member 23 [Folsomia candida]